MKNENRYNTRVRQAMSDQYVACTKQKCEVGRKIHDLDLLLHSEEGKKLPYEKYVRLEKDLEMYEKEHLRLKIELGIWDQAREICMELADELL